MSSNKRKKTILVTAAGGAGTIYIIKSLIGKYRIIAVDMDKYAAGLYLADKGYVLPPCNHRNYFKKLDAIIKKEKVDVIIPLIDEELLPIRQRYQHSKTTKILLPSEHFIKLCLDKWQLMNALSAANIPCPKTYQVTSMQRLPGNLLPGIIKPITGRGSRGFWRINNQEDFRNYFKSNPYGKEDVIVQEAVLGKEFTVSVVVSGRGEVLSVVPKEIILKKGITNIAVTRRNLKIDRVCRQIQKHLRADGPFNVQLIMDKKTGTPKVFEINPRFSTTVALTMAAGVDEVGLLIESLFTGKTSKAHFKKNLVMVRYQEQYYLPEYRLKPRA